MAAEYEALQGGAVRRVADGALIPADPLNTDYQRFLEWQEAGNTPDTPPPPGPTVVLSVLPVALRRALRNTPAPGGGAPNALAYVQGALATPGLEDAADAFEYMVRAERADMVALGGPLGFPVEVVDAVLELAATYPGADAVRGPAP
jgi:hypothetical protein